MKYSSRCTLTRRDQGAMASSSPMLALSIRVSALLFFAVCCAESYSSVPTVAVGGGICGLRVSVSPRLTLRGGYDNEYGGGGGDYGGGGGYGRRE